MKSIYLDIFSGISGDMFIGATLDLGVDFHEFERELRKLKLEGYHIHAARKQKANIDGVKFDVHLAHDHDHVGDDHDHEKHSHAAGHEHEHEHGRSFAQIKKLIGVSELSAWVKEKAVAIFQRVAIAEGKIHGRPPESVHFHEVGAVDSIVDIVVACISLEMLGKPRLISAPVVEGRGWIDCAHGRFPIPAPATVEILASRKIPISQS